LSNEVKDMAYLTMLSNRLNPIQEKNMKMYPHVFFDGVKSAVITYDLECRPDSSEPKRDTWVKYEIAIDPKTKIDHREKRILALQQAIQTLFWSDVRVDVILSGGSNE
jgi:hypothetical protein